MNTTASAAALAALLLAFAAPLTGAASGPAPVNARATALRLTHALKPGPAVRAWQEQVRESVLKATPRPDPLPVFRYVVRYTDGAELPVVVRWGESVEDARRRTFTPVSRFIGPMAWADVSHQSPLDYERDIRDVRYTMRWPNPRPDQPIATVRVEPVPEAGTPLFYGLEADPAPPTGKFYYVAPGGDDDGPGTFDRPWATPHKAAASARAGDTVFFRAGTWKLAAPVMPAHSGREGAPITFCNYPGETAVFNGRALTSDRPRNDLVVQYDGAPAALISSRTGVFHILGRAHIRVLGLDVRDSSWAGIAVDALPWWPVAGVSETRDQPRIPASHHIEILHCRVQRTADVGIGVYGSIIPRFRTIDHVRVVGNLIQRAHDKETLLESTDAWRAEFQQEMRRRGRAKGGDENLDFHAVRHLESAFNEISHGGKEGMDLMNGTRHARVHHNYVHDLFFTNWSGSPCAIYLDCRSEQFDIEVDHNVCERNGQGIQANAEDGAPFRDIRIHHNLCKDNYWNGINVSLWRDDAKEIRDVTIEHNTIVHNGWLEKNKAPAGGIHIGSRNPRMHDVVVRENICADNRDYQIAHHKGDPKAADIVIARNLVWPEELKTFERANWATRWVPTRGDEALIAAPRFIDPENYNFGLRPDSPGPNLGAFPRPAEPAR